MITCESLRIALKLFSNYLVGGFNHLEKYESQWVSDDIPFLWKIKAMFETTNQLCW